MLHHHRLEQVKICFTIQKFL